MDYKEKQKAEAGKDELCSLNNLGPAELILNDNYAVLVICKLVDKG